MESQCTVMVKSFQHFDFAGGGGGMVGDYEGVGSHYDSFSIKPKYSTLGYILWSIVWFC